MSDAPEPVFPPEELRRRLEAVRGGMAAADLDGLVISVPESIYYLTGLDHWGFFACHLLIVPRDGEMILTCRAMEGITVRNQVTNARFMGHRDDEDIADYAARALQESGLRRGRLGLEMRSLFLTPRIADALRAKLPGADWQDASGLIDGIRIVKSPLEMDYTRRAAKAADAGTLAAIEALGDGVPDYEVAAACHAAMIRAGSEYPGFGPFIRPTTRLGEEHTTWRGDVFRHGDAAFLEIAAAYRKYQAPMGRLIYIGTAPDGAERSADLAIEGMRAICAALKPGATAGEVYAAWHAVAAAAGLPDYHRHHCGYSVGIGFPPSWTGGSMVTGLAPNSPMVLKVGMTFHAHSWFTNTDCVDYFISNTVMLGENGPEILTEATPETLIVR
jgi:Xaa-Pro dipeptidase